MSDWTRDLSVASPCSESWEAMTGDARRRHCGRCDQHVYDLSGLSEAEALALVTQAQAGAEVCVRFRRRQDGTVLLADCPSGLREARRATSTLRALAAGALAVLGLGLQGCEPEAGPRAIDTPTGPFPPPRATEPSPTPAESPLSLDPAELPHPDEMIMGRVVCPPPREAIPSEPSETPSDESEPAELAPAESQPDSQGPGGRRLPRAG